MAILKTCCCWKSIKRGSFASGFYTLAFYTVIVTAGIFHVNTVYHTPGLLAFSLLMVVLSGICVFSSVLLLVGLCVDNRVMLIPWIISVSLTTLSDVILSIYLFMESTSEPFHGVLLAIDIVMCALNVYCILCVISQYQEYLAARGASCQPTRQSALPAVHYYSSTVNPFRTQESTASKVNTNGIKVAKSQVVVTIPSATTSAVHGKSSRTSSSNNIQLGLPQLELSSITEEQSLDDTVMEKTSSDATDAQTKDEVAAESKDAALLGSELTTPTTKPEDAFSRTSFPLRRSSSDSSPDALDFKIRLRHYYAESENEPLLTAEGGSDIQKKSYSSFLGKYRRGDPSQMLKSKNPRKSFTCPGGLGPSADLQNA